MDARELDIPDRRAGFGVVIAGEAKIQERAKSLEKFVRESDAVSGLSRTCAIEYGIGCSRERIGVVRPRRSGHVGGSIKPQTWPYAPSPVSKAAFRDIGRTIILYMYAQLHSMPSTRDRSVWRSMIEHDRRTFNVKAGISQAQPGHDGRVPFLRAIRQRLALAILPARPRRNRRGTRRRTRCGRERVGEHG